MKPRWRLLMEGLCDGRRNMATDLALFKACEESLDAAPTLRVYGWSRPTLSLAHSQSQDEDVDLQRAQQEGVSIVRRPTGGRALLQFREVTYAVTAPVGAAGLRFSLKDIFEDISRFLIAALMEMGVPAGDVQFQNEPKKRGGRRRSAACFAELHFGEITVNDRKLVGSAQRRGKNAFLQHGSIPLEEDIALFTRLCRYPTEKDRQDEEARLRAGTTALNREVAAGVTFDRAAGALVSGFGSSGVFDLEPGDLTQQECELRDAILKRS